MDQSTVQYLWVECIIEELIRLDVKSFYLASGSRSTPLVLAIARNNQAQSTIHFDERALAYMAVGEARMRQKPCVLISTSGTAAVNFYPAILEASQDNIPLLIITADRPWELRACGANQSIDQVKLYGSSVRWFSDIPTPSSEIPLESLLSSIDYAVHQCQCADPGPVHLNSMFREPFYLPSEHIPTISSLAPIPWMKSTQPYTQYHHAGASPEINLCSEHLQMIRQKTQGIIVLGRMKSRQDIKEFIHLAEHLQWPIFPDILSQGYHEKASCLITTYDHILKEKTDALNPGIILHFGNAILSKSLNEFIQAFSGTYMMFDASQSRIDPSHRVTHRIVADPSKSASFLRLNLPKGAGSPEWLKIFQSRHQQIASVLTDYFESQKDLSEPLVSYLLAKHLEVQDILFVANSMPVRYMNSFSYARQSHCIIQANRGTSGIDGTLASAVGCAKAAGKPVTFFTGDLTLLHDMNSLALLADPDIVLRIIVLNNQGGGIFSLLPIEKWDHAHFEKFFGTPHTFNFEALARFFNLNHKIPETPDEFVEAWTSLCGTNQSFMIEIPSDRAANRRTLNLIQETLAKRCPSISS